MRHFFIYFLLFWSESFISILMKSDLATAARRVAASLVIAVVSVSKKV